MRLVGPGRAGKGVSELSGNRKQDYPLQNKHIFLINIIVLDCFYKV